MAEEEGFNTGVAVTEGEGVEATSGEAVPPCPPTHSPPGENDVDGVLEVEAWP